MVSKGLGVSDPFTRCTHRSCGLRAVGADPDTKAAQEQRQQRAEALEGARQQQAEARQRQAEAKAEEARLMADFRVVQAPS